MWVQGPCSRVHSNVQHLNMGERAQLGIACVLRATSSASPLQYLLIMRAHQTLDLPVGHRLPAYEPYAPEPITREITEVFHRLDHNEDADEPPPLPPVPARGSQVYPVVTLYPRFR
jgi:hypothetical protein